LKCSTGLPMIVMLVYRQGHSSIWDFSENTEINAKEYLSIDWLCYCTVHVYVVKLFLWSCSLFEWKRICAFFFFYHLFIHAYVVIGDPVISIQYNPVTLLCLSQARTWISNVICCFLFLCSVKMRGDCSFHWYWWNGWPSLLNFLFIRKVLGEGSRIDLDLVYGV
jgi:hypothetical protein